MLTAAVHAELTADAERIVLIAAGVVEDVALLAKYLQVLTPLVSKSDPPGAVHVPATWPAVCQLAEIYGQAWRPGPRLCSWVAEQVRQRTAVVPEVLTVPPPPGCVPRPYQVAGAGLIAASGRVVLGDEAGAGKTITTVLGLVELAARRGDITPVVVVAPASVVDPWVTHFRRWAPGMTTVAWRGAPARRRKLAGTADVYVCSYDTARMDAAGGRDQPLVALGPRTVVVDEHHLIKSATAERTKAVRRIARRSRWFVALSGTPITHAADDWWPTLDLLEPGAWPSRERWTSRYCLTASGDYRDEVLGLAPGTEPEFRRALLGRYRRVAKADVLTQLPPKVYSTRSVTLPAKWRKAYDDMEKRMLAELPDGSELAVMSTLAKLTRLAQLASAAADVEIEIKVDEDGTEHEHVHVTLRAPSWKVDALLEILAERPGSPVVAFAPSRQLMVLARDAAAKAGHRAGAIIGGQSMTERTATIEAFQDGQLDLVCVTTAAGGTGITLTAAATAVFLQRPWSLVESSQAEDRLHRIGAERHRGIEIIDIDAENTLDARVRAVLRERAGALAELVQDPRIVAELLGGTGRKAA